MSKLITPKKWKEREFAAGSRPDNRTVRRWIERGEISGVLLNDGHFYVHEHARLGSTVDATTQAHVTKLLNI